jgi:hypothetical protein
MPPAAKRAKIEGGGELKHTDIDADLKHVQKLLSEKFHEIAKAKATPKKVSTCKLFRSRVGK